MEKIFVIAICGCVVLALLKNIGSPYIILAQAALILLVGASVFPQFKELFSLIESFGIYEIAGKESVTILFKIFALLLAGGVAADICRDNGENALGGVVEISVKIMGIVLSVPVLSAVVSIALSFVRN